MDKVQLRGAVGKVPTEVTRWPPTLLHVRICEGLGVKFPWSTRLFYFRGKHKLYLYRASDEHGQVIDRLLRDKRDRVSAEAFFRRAVAHQR